MENKLTDRRKDAKTHFFVLPVPAASFSVCHGQICLAFNAQTSNAEYGLPPDRKCVSLCQRGTVRPDRGQYLNLSDDRMSYDAGSRIFSSEQVLLSALCSIPSRTYLFVCVGQQDLSDLCSQIVLVRPTVRASFTEFLFTAAVQL